MITVRCQCGETYNADEEHVGRRMLCRNCNQVLLIQPQPPSSIDTSVRPEPEVEPEPVRDSRATPLRRRSHRIKAPVVAKMIVVSLTLAAMVLLWESEHRKPTTSLPNETTIPAQPRPPSSDGNHSQPSVPSMQGSNQAPSQERQAQPAPESNTQRLDAAAQAALGADWKTRFKPRDLLTSPVWHALPLDAKDYTLLEISADYRATEPALREQYLDSTRNGPEY